MLALALAAVSARDVRGQDLPSQPLALAGGHVVIGTDIAFSTSTASDEGAWFNYTDYEHNAMRLLRLSVSTRIRLNDRVAFLGEVRSENGDSVRPYGLYARLHPWAHAPIDIQAGRIPPTFGAFSRRTYGNGNPLIGYPLAYQYLTSLRPDAVPADADELLQMRARGWRPGYTIGSQAVVPGMPLLTAFDWDTGVQVHAGTDRLALSAAVTNGTVSDPRARDNNRGKQVSARAQWQPALGLVLGGSAASGPYLSDEVRKLIGDSNGSDERALGFDAEYSRAHWIVRSEGIWNRWEMPTLAVPLTATGTFVEAVYKFHPGWYAAARADALRFSNLTGTKGTLSWDAPVTRLEAGVGAYVRRNLLVRGTYQHNRRSGGFIRSQEQMAVQFQFWL